MSGIESRARFDIVRYAQVWEDADVLLRGLAIRPGDRVLSIASAGDNVLALLTADPAKVVAVDLSRVQLECLKFRMAAYRCLLHDELLRLMGSRPSRDQGRDRGRLFMHVLKTLPRDSRSFWEGRKEAIEAHGLGGIGKFENYFRIFRQHVLPLVHSSREIDSLLVPKSREERERFHDEIWSNRRWRWMLQLFFSKTVMGHLGRDPSFFAYSEGSFWKQVAERTRHALVELDPSANPYLHWILKGTHGAALPVALREENFKSIRDRLDRIEIVEGPIDASLGRRDGPFDAFNLSDIFEYMDVPLFERIYGDVVAMAAPGARLVYWNMMAPRWRPDSFEGRVERVRPTAVTLQAEDKAFFYMAVQAEAVL